MSPQNKAFVGAVDSWRASFISLLKRAGVDSTVYASKHFCERVVERNLEIVDVLHLITPVIREHRETTYNIRRYIIQWRDIGLVAEINIGPISKKRQVILKTIYDKIYPGDFDVHIKM